MKRRGFAVGLRGGAASLHESNNTYAKPYEKVPFHVVDFVEPVVK